MRQHGKKQEKDVIFRMEVEPFHRGILLSNCVNLQLCNAGFVQADPQWNFPGVCSPFSRLYLPLSGEGLVSIRGITYKLSPNGMFIIPCNESCDYQCPRRMDLLYFHFNLFLPDGRDLFSFFHELLESPISEHETSELLDNLRSGQFSQLLFIRQKFYSLLVNHVLCKKELAQWLKNRQYSPFLCSVLNLIQSRLSARLKVSDIACALGYTPETLSRQFKKEMGCGLKEYMDSLIFQRATLLLSSTGDTISQITQELGFSDPFYFSAFFKKRAGCPPTEYRKNAVKY